MVQSPTTDNRESGQTTMDKRDAAWRRLKRGCYESDDVVYQLKTGSYKVE